MSSQVLTTDAVRLGLTASDKLDAIRQSGDLLVRIGAADEVYAKALFEREATISTYLGEGFAIPHGTNESRSHIIRTALGFLQFPGGVNWDGETCYVCIPIASNSDEHVSILGALAEVLMDEDAANELRTTTDPARVVELLTAEA